MSNNHLLYIKLLYLETGKTNFGATIQRYILTIFLYNKEAEGLRTIAPKAIIIINYLFIEKGVAPSLQCKCNVIIYYFSNKLPKRFFYDENITC